jgi:predicted enzyme related to lactoylglutathione lyase
MSKRSIVHVEIPAANRDSLAKFYAEMFGWNFQHMTEPSPYTTFEAGNVGGGYPDVSDQSKPGDVLVYVDSEDIDADLKKIERLGGKTLMPKTAIGTMGWFAIFADPTGNNLALFTAAKA